MYGMNKEPRVVVLRQDTGAVSVVDGVQYLGAGTLYQDADGKKIWEPDDSHKFTAGVDLIRRTGAIEFRVGYSDPDDGKPVVWYACATYLNDTSEVDAALNPEKAVLRLCERLIDGGLCTHCNKTTVFEENFEDANFYELIGLGSLCVYGWDPELKVFRRGCE